MFFAITAKPKDVDFRLQRFGKLNMVYNSSKQLNVSLNKPINFHKIVLNVDSSRSYAFLTRDNLVPSSLPLLRATAKYLCLVT